VWTFPTALFLAIISVASLTAATAATRAGPDQTAALQQAIANLGVDGVLDCHGALSKVSTLLLKSRMTIRNCRFEAIPGSADFASPVTADGRSQAINGLTIQNVHIVGNRHLQTNIGYSGEEDGGRHCFRLLGNVSNVLIENSSGSYCASDGIALVSYGVSLNDSAENLPFRHITIRNSSFFSNRRHGASGDGLSDVTFENVTFSDNGTTETGGAEGDQCASAGNQCYGTGFWYEDYRPGLAGEGINGLTFAKCIFRKNFQRSLFFMTRTQPSAPGYQARANIRILNSYLDAGVNPLTEDYAVQFQADDSLVGQGVLFSDITIANTSMDGSIGLRQAANIRLVSSAIKTTLQYLGYAAYATNIAFRDVQPMTKQLAVSFAPSGADNPIVSYSSGSINQSSASTPPQSGLGLKGEIVWNSQKSGPVGWVCLATGTPCLQWQSF
jgi:hypothetical protein